MEQVGHHIRDTLLEQRNSLQAEVNSKAIDVLDDFFLPKRDVTGLMALFIQIDGAMDDRVVVTWDWTIVVDSKNSSFFHQDRLPAIHSAYDSVRENIEKTWRISNQT